MCMYNTQRKFLLISDSQGGYCLQAVNDIVGVGMGRGFVVACGLEVVRGLEGARGWGVGSGVGRERTGVELVLQIPH